MRPSHATKGGRRYRYYVSAALIDGSIATGTSGWRIPAAEIETAIATAIAARLRQPAFVSALIRADDMAQADPSRVADALEAMARRLDDASGTIARQSLAAIVQGAQMSETEVQVDVGFAGRIDNGSIGAADAALLGDIGFSFTAQIRMARRGSELRLVLQGAAAPARRPDPKLIRELIAARIRVADYMASGGALSISDLARRNGVHLGEASRSLQLGFLAPDLVERILDGDQPAAFTAERLSRLGELPLLWSQQRELF